MKPYKHPTGGWTYDFIVMGRRFQRGGFATMREAEEAGIAARRKARRLQTIDVGFLKLCSSRLDDLQAKRSNRHYLENQKLIDNLIVLWGDKTEITRDNVESFLRSMAVPHNVLRTSILRRRKQGDILFTHEAVEGSNALANRTLRLVRALFSYGVKRGWIPDNPCRGIERFPEAPRPRYVPPLEDVLKVIDAATPEQRDYLLVITNTMARVREVNNLAWSDIRNDHLILRTRKAKCSDLTERRIPLNQTLREILDRLPRAGKYVFMNKDTGKNYDYRSKMLFYLCKKAGVPYFTFHCLRHLGASRLMKGGVALTDIQKLLGHQRTTTTDRYLHSIGDGLVEAVKKLEGLK